MIGGIVLLAILTSALLIYQFSKTEYSLAYTDLNASDAAALQQYLEAAGIPYKFSQDGKTVAVPSTKVTDVKIGAESQNLLKNGSIGYGIFRDHISSFGMTDNQFELLSTDAKAGEIQQLINAIDGVIESKVLLSLPEETVFIRENNASASASVVIRFQPGYPIEQNKIDTMYNLVSKSVKNLSEENITISDQNGELLPSSRLNASGSSSLGLVSQHMQIKKQYEAEVQKNIQNFLGRILGQDKVVVNVWSTLNFDQKSHQEKRFEPVNELSQKGIERSVQEIQKSYTSEGSPVPGGIAGMGDTDIPTYNSLSNSGPANSEEIEKIVNYEINEISSSIISSPYVVQDLTVFAGIEPPNPNDPDSLTEETRQEIERMLVNIVDASLVDSEKRFSREEIESKVSVITHNFRGTNDVFGGSEQNSYLLYGFIALAILTVVLGGITAVQRTRKRKTDSLIENENETVIDQPKQNLIEVSDENEIKTQLNHLAQNKPEDFVNLLRTWLTEE